MKKPKAYAGIDPGINGAISFMTKNGIISVVDMPTERINPTKNKKRMINIQSLRYVLKGFKIKHAFVEQVYARPGQGVTSMFNFGRSMGAIEGLLCGLEIEYTKVLPQAWKRHFDLINADKDDARLTAISLFPLWKSSFKYKKDVDKADAALICKYGIDKILAGG